MIVILAIDGLEHSLVEQFNLTNLQQEYYGKTNITEYSEPRTMVLWSSFITGQNKESEVLIDGKNEMWDKKWTLEESFFKNFKSPIIIDLPGYSYEEETHRKSRELLKDYFMSQNPDEKQKIKQEYNKDAFDHHRTIKTKFLQAVDEDHDFVLGYFSLADVIGHLNFGNTTLMKMIYQEFDELAKLLRQKDIKLIILSDHGMKSIGLFGDHSTYGFWSSNVDLNFDFPRITDFYSIDWNKLSSLDSN